MKTLALAVAAAVLFSACATVPSGPTVMVLPGSAKSFEQFQNDDAACRSWASQQSGTTSHTGAEKTATGAAIGTLVGAALGAAVGAAAGSPATGAAVGAGVGLAGGAATGASAAEGAYATGQRRYDTSYVQCMYSKGNQIPVARGSQPAYASQPLPPPPPPPPPAGSAPGVSGHVPPPPAGTPPPPPAGPTR